MTDIEMLPLPEHTEAGEFTFDAHVFEHTDMVNYARAVAEHNVNRERERAERLAEALLELCNVIDGHEVHVAVEGKAAHARAALRDHDQEEGSGAFWGSSPKSGGPDWTGFDG